MSLQDPLADFICCIKNAQQRRFKKLIVPSSKIKEQICKILKAEGYILDYNIVKNEHKKNIKIDLQYYESYPVIEEFKRVSKPSCRIYINCKNLPKVKNGLGIAILSTSKGIMTSYEATKKKVGGELICEIF